MPYALQSPLGSGLAAAAGFMAGDTEKKRYLAEQQRQAQLDQQAQANTAAQLGMTAARDRATDASRSASQADAAARLKLETDKQAKQDAADADTAKRQKLIDTFQAGGLHYPPNYDKMKPEQKIAYLQVRLNKAQQAGDQKTVGNTETEINRVATQAEADRRQAAADRKADAPAKPTYADLHPRAREGRTVSPRDAYFASHGYDPPTYSEAHPTTKTKAQSIPAQRSADADSAGAAIKKGGDRDAIVKHYAAKWNITTDKASDELPDAP